MAELRARHEALQQTATMPGADLRPLLDAALAELDGAIDALGTAQAQPAGTGKQERAAGSVHAERRLLHAVFQQVPVPLFVLGQDGTVRRANPAASALLGAARGYPTGKPFSALVEPSGRPAVRSLLAAAARSEQGRQLDCQLLTAKGRVSCTLDVRPVSVRGDDDWLLVAARDAIPPARPGTAPLDGTPPAEAPPDPMVTVMTRRLDLATTASRLLLENVTFSESVTLQRCARLLSEALGAWVIVDMDRGGLLRRHFVTGPDKHESGQLAQTVAAVNPEPGSLPVAVRDSASTLLVTHAEDNDILGAGPGGVPLLALLGAGSVLCVPLSDGEQTHGVLTLARDPSRGYFSLADVGLVEEIAEQLALAMSVRHGCSAPAPRPPRRSRPACSRRSCGPCPGSRSPPRTWPPPRAGRSAATSTTCTRPRTAGAWPSATCAGRVRTPPRSPPWPGTRSGSSPTGAPTRPRCCAAPTRSCWPRSSAAAS